MRGLEHWVQTAFAEPEIKIFSNRAPQSRHSYSKIGMDFPLSEYIQPGFRFQSGRLYDEGGDSYPHQDGTACACLHGSREAETLHYGLSQQPLA